MRGLGAALVSVRWLNLQEYQSKKLMADNGINVQKFHMAETVDEAHNIAHTFSLDICCCFLKYIIILLNTART